MSLLTWLESKATGVDLAAEQARGNAADAQLSALNTQALNSGHYDQATYDLAVQDAAAGATGDVTAQVGEAFMEGASQGLQNVIQAPGKLVGAAGSLSGSVLWGIIKAIPWWVWVAAAGALFIWLGGLSMLRGRLARE